jgi:predicted dehydrogenase
MCEAALDAGLGVLVEKPLSQALGEAEQLLVNVRERGALVMVDHTHLFSPAFRRLLGARAELGRPRFIRGKAGNPPPPSDAPVLWNWGAHDVAMSIALVGQEPSRATASLLERRPFDGGFAEHVRIELEFSGGTRATFDVGNTVVKKQRRFAAEFEGEVWVYDDQAPSKLVRHGRATLSEDETGEGEAVPLPSELPLTTAIREFGAALREGSRDTASLELGVSVVRTLSECETSLAR